MAESVISFLGLVSRTQRDTMREIIKTWGHVRRP
jgi:hypothetical protein